MAQHAMRGRVYTRIMMKAILMTMEVDGDDDDDEGSFPVVVTIRMKIITGSEYK